MCGLDLVVWLSLSFWFWSTCMWLCLVLSSTSVLLLNSVPLNIVLLPLPVICQLCSSGIMVSCVCCWLWIHGRAFWVGGVRKMWRNTARNIHVCTTSLWELMCAEQFVWGLFLNLMCQSFCHISCLQSYSSTMKSEILLHLNMCRVQYSV